MTLARTFGRWDVDRFLAEIPEPVFQQWLAMYRIDPWGEERADLRNGILCSLTDACHRAKGQPQAPIHYMPYCQPGRREGQTVEQMKQIVGVIKRHLSKRRKRKAESGQ